MVASDRCTACAISRFDKARRHQPQDFPFAMANILIFIETFRVHGASGTARGAGRPALPGRGTLGFRFPPAFPHRQQPQRVVLEQPAVAEIPGFLERGEEQADGFSLLPFCQYATESNKDKRSRRSPLVSGRVAGRTAFQLALRAVPRDARTMPAEPPARTRAVCASACRSPESPARCRSSCRQTRSASFGRRSQQELHLAAHGVSIDTLVAGREQPLSHSSSCARPCFQRRRRRSALAADQLAATGSSTGVATSRQTVASGSSASTPACRSCS